MKDIVEQIFSNRKITRSDQAYFMAIASSNRPLSPEDEIRIEWVFQSLRRGDVRVAD